MNTVPLSAPRDASQFQLVSHWHLAAPIDAVWEAIKATEQWPRWWPYVKRVDELKRGDADGVGAVRHMTWSSRLPYGVAFDIEVIESRRPRLLSARARGQLNGQGTWELTPDGDTTRVRYTWCVDLTTRWMRFMAPIAAPVFRWNHDAVMRAVAPLAAPVFRWNHNGVMRAGAQGLARHLGGRLIQAF